MALIIYPLSSVVSIKFNDGKEFELKAKNPNFWDIKFAHHTKGDELLILRGMGEYNPKEGEELYAFKITEMKEEE